MFYKRPTRSGRLRFRSSILSIGFLVLGWVKSPEILRGQAIGESGNVQGSTQSIKYASDYNWRQSPSSPPTLAAGANTIRLAPCPRGFMVSTAPIAAPYVPTHYVYIAGTGAAETAKITRVSEYAGDSSCQFSGYIKLRIERSVVPSGCLLCGRMTVGGIAMPSLCASA